MTTSNNEASRRYRQKKKAERDLWKNFYHWPRPQGIGEWLKHRLAPKP